MHHTEMSHGSKCFKMNKLKTQSPKNSVYIWTHTDILVCHSQIFGVQRPKIRPSSPPNSYVWPKTCAGIRKQGRLGYCKATVLDSYCQLRDLHCNNQLHYKHY